MEAFIRTAALIGEENLEKLNRARVAIFGVGGVGGYVAEGFARSGVGTLHLIDNDRVNVSNINRQIIALHSTIGQYKTDVAKARAEDINPQIRVYTHNVFFLPDTPMPFALADVDYVVDAIDTVSGKLAIIEACKRANVPVISCMGTGNKLNPSMLEVADISKTSVCPLARVMRRELKARGIERVKTVYSKEEPIRRGGGQAGEKIPPASIAFVPPVAGLLIASEVVKDIVLGL